MNLLPRNHQNGNRKSLLEQLRALDHGIPIKALITDCDQMAVDTPEDLQRVAAVMGLDLDEVKEWMIK